MKHMSKALVFLFALVFSLSVLQSAHAAVIGSYHYRYMIGPTQTPVPGSTRFTLWIGSYSDLGEIIGVEYRPEWGPVLAVDLTPADVGKTFTVTNGAAFDIAVESLTNGILDSCSWSGFNDGHGGPETFPWLAESNWQDPDGAGYHVNGYYGGTNGIDFEGFVIDSISFRLDDYQNRNWALTIFVGGEPGVTDYTPPSCDHTGTNSGPPRSYEITVQDNQSGLAALYTTSVENFSVDIQPFTVGTTEPVIVTATKINKSKRSFLALETLDMVGNVTQFDPADEADNPTLVPSSSGAGSGGCFIATAAPGGMRNGTAALLLFLAAAAVAAVLGIRSGL